MKKPAIKLSLAISAILAANIVSAVDVGSEATKVKVKPQVSDNVNNDAGKEITKLRKGIKKAKIQAKKLKASLFDIQEDYYTFKDEAEADIAGKERYINELKESHVSLIGQYEDNIRSASVNIAKLEKSIIDLRSSSSLDKKELLSKASEISALIDSANKKDKELSDASSRLDKANAKIAKMTEHASKVKSKNSSLITTINGLKADKDAAILDFETAKSRLAKAVKELSDIKELESSNKKELAAMARLIDSSSSEAGILRAEIVESKEIITKQSTEISVLKDSVAKTNKLNKDLNTEIEKKVARIEGLVSELQRKESEISNTDSSEAHLALIKEYEANMRAASIHANNLHAELMELTEKNKSVASELAIAKGEKSKMSKAAEGRINKIKDLAIKIEELTLKNNELESEILEKGKKLAEYSNSKLALDSLRKKYEENRISHLDLIIESEKNMSSSSLYINKLGAEIVLLENGKKDIFDELSKKTEELEALTALSSKENQEKSNVDVMISKLEKENYKIKKDLHSKASKIDSLLSDITSKDKKLAALKGKQGSLMEIVSDAENSLIESNDKVSVLESNLEKLVNDISSMQDNNAVIESELLLKKEMLEKLTLDLKGAELKAERYRVHSIDKIKAYESDMHEGSVYINKLSQEIEYMKNHRSSLEAKLEAAESMISSLNDSEFNSNEKYKALMAEVLSLKAENKRIFNNLSRALKERDLLSAGVARSSESIKGLVQDNASHIGLIKEYENNMRESSLHISKLSAEIKGLTEKNETMLSQIDAGKQRISELLKLTKESKPDAGLNELNAEIEKLVNQLSVLRATNEAQKSQLSEMITNSASHKKILKEKDGLIDELKAAISNLDKSLIKEKNLSDELKAEISRIEKEIDAKDSSNVRIKSLMSEIDTITKELSGLRGSTNAKNEKLIAQIDVLMLSKGEADKKVAEQEEKLNASESKVKELSSLLEAGNNNGSTAAEIANEIIKYQETISSLKDKNFNITRELNLNESSSSAEIKRYAEKVEKLKGSISVLKAKAKDSKEKEKSAIASMKAEHDKKVSILTSKVEAITEAMKKTKDSLRKNILQMDNNVSITKALRDNISDLESELSNQDSAYSKDREEAATKLTDLNRELLEAKAELNKELIQSKESMVSKNNEIDNLFEEIANLKNQRSSIESDMVFVKKRYENQIVDLKKDSSARQDALNIEKATMSNQLKEAEAQVLSLTEKLSHQQRVISDKATEIYLVNKQLSNYAANPNTKTHSSVIELINSLDKGILTGNIYDKNLLNDNMVGATKRTKNALSTLRNYSSNKVSEKIQDSIDTLVEENVDLDSGNKLLSMEVDKLKENLKVSLTQLANERAESRRLIKEKEGLQREVESLSDSVDLLNTYEKTIDAFKKNSFGAKEKARNIIKKYILDGEYSKAKTIYDSMDYVSRYSSEEDEEMNNIFMFLSGADRGVLSEANMAAINDSKISNYIIQTLTDKLQENKNLLKIIEHIDIANISDDDKARSKIQVYIKVGNLTESLSLSTGISNPTKDDKNIREFIEKTLNSIEKIFSINLIN